MNRLLCWLLLALALLPLSARADWISDTPIAPSVTVVAVDSARGHLLEGLDGGGLWESGDGGVMWTPAHALYGLRPVEDVRDIRFYDAAGDTILIEAAERPYDLRRYLLATDGGLVYQDVTPHVMPYTTAYFTLWNRNPNVWLGIGWDEPFGGNHFLRSTNGGLSYQQYEMPGNLARPLIQDPTDDSTLYALCNLAGNNGTVLRSTNLGETWAPMVNLDSLYGLGDAAVQTMQHLSNGDLLLGLAPLNSTLPRLLISTDDGVSWIDSSNALPARYAPAQIIEDRSLPGIVLMTGVDQREALISGDYGRHWNSVEGLPLPAPTLLGLSQDPFNHRLRLCLREQGVWESTNHGALWQPASAPPAGSAGKLMAQYGYTTYTTAESQYFVRPLSESWDPIHIPVGADTLQRVDPPVFCSGLTTIVPVYRRASQDDAETHHLAFSYDEGRSWVVRPELPFTPGVWGSVPTLIETTYLINIPYTPGPFGQMYLSTDFGVTWETRETPGGYYFSGVAAVSPNAIYIGAVGELIGDHVFRSTDLGLTWQSLEWPGGWIYGSVAFTPVGDDLLLTRVSSFGQPYESWYWSADIAQWQQRGMIADTTEGLRVAVIPTDGAPVFVAAASGSQLWRSRDYALTWEPFAAPIPYAAQGNHFTSLAWDDARQRLWVGTALGTCYLPGGDIGADTPERPTPVDAFSLAAYPNPFNATVKIQYHLSRAGSIKLELYDITGRLVRVLRDAVEPAGNFVLPVSGDGLASGVYLVRLTAPDAHRTTKLVLLK